MSSIVTDTSFSFFIISNSLSLIPNTEAGTCNVEATEVSEKIDIKSKFFLSVFLKSGKFS